ncbi:hypothetical protein [Streptomyces fulvorobeus]|uniref:Uncharacterized protein n=1 Tax=Streptomyces fulvorobeus TaxID=284028 RepID=A0A7J0CBS2_9ACTN|nr:hypothetical protein [Streptomyces fulvorobeus]NYE42823.1 hypothetical protein [Streptomyces fulvorobeus]GFM99244.1 hypothetical protein Sfulv_40550 [Streptomyces fulvorobeus]
MDEETQPQRPGTERVVCVRCATAVQGEIAPPTWSCSMENGTRQYLWDVCARAHIRATDSRLGPTWW